MWALNVYTACPTPAQYMTFRGQKPFCCMARSSERESEGMLLGGSWAHNVYTKCPHGQGDALAV
eukprot:8745147-Prorocentrum_lima.AAC.1